MVYVRIELWPGGDKAKAKLLQEVKIANDATGDLAAGNYDVTVSHSTTYKGKGFTDVLAPKPAEIWKIGRVLGFDRAQSPAHLVRAAISAALSSPRRRE